MRKNILINLIILIAFNYTYGQLKEPVNNCKPNPGNASGGDPCDSRVEQTYNPCECQYIKDYQAYLNKRTEYTNKLRQINIELQNYRVSASSPYHLRGMTEADGFSTEKRKYLNDLRNRLSKAQKGLSLSYEKERYCIVANCANSNIREFKNYISEINSVISETNSMQPAQNVTLKVNSSTDNSSNSSSELSNSTVNKKNENEIDSSIKREYNLRNEVNKIEQSGNYALAAQIKNANPDVFSDYEIKSANANVVAQGTLQLMDAIFYVDPKKAAARQKIRDNNRKAYKRFKENKKERLKEEIMSDFSANGLAVKKNKKGWYGYIDKDNNWIIKPKYLDADPFENGKAKVITKTGKSFYINFKGEKI